MVSAVETKSYTLKEKKETGSRERQAIGVEQQSELRSLTKRIKESRRSIQRHLFDGMSE